MALIRRRGTRWQSVIRRKGLPKQSRAFAIRADAEAWAREIESEMDRGRGGACAPTKGLALRRGVAARGSSVVSIRSDTKRPSCSTKHDMLSSCSWISDRNNGNAWELPSSRRG